ncbi:MAG TPA: phosphotransferase [Micromonosporaceae bacterium]|jgi:hypothetical protein|nr:phosphotransferase [Micromonosporaceae bacterium]
MDVDDFADLVPAHLPPRRPVRVTRLAGGSKKGVYRLVFDDGATTVAYVWRAAENFWPAAPETDPDDPFRDSSGIDLFDSAHRRLAGLGVRTPEVLALDRSRAHVDADVAFVEDLTGGTLEALIERDRAAADGPLAMLRDALAAMHGATSPSFGSVATVDADRGVTSRPAADIVFARAQAHLAEAAAYEPRIEAHRDALAAVARDLAAAVPARNRYALIHGELGPDHVMLDDRGRPALIDIEGLAYFDVEWEHVFLRMRFRDDYPALAADDLDPHRMRFYQFAHHLSLIAGPLRIATAAGFPDVDFMREVAHAHTGRALAFL